MNTILPRMIFPEDFDERAQFEMPLRGYLSGALVEAPDGKRYSVNFYDPVRLQQTLTDDTKRGQSYFAEPGLIVLPDVTLENIDIAIQHLWSQNYFAHLVPEKG